MSYLMGRSVSVAAYLVITLFLFLYPALSSAEVYKWIDDKGNIVFSDSPPAGVDAREIKVKDNNRTEMQQAREERPKAKKKDDNSRLRDLRDISIILYMTDWCPYCRKAKDYLASSGLTFTEYNIDKDRKKGEEMKQKSGSKAVPVIDVEGIIIRGYAPEAIQSAITRKRSVVD
jgi:glutaredoxin-like YruB-family protein